MMRYATSLLLFAAALNVQAKSPLRFAVSWDKPLDGHVVLVISDNNRQEPRMQISEGLDTQQMFGADVDKGTTVIIDGSAIGYPRASLDQVPVGEYYVQAVL